MNNKIVQRFLKYIFGPKCEMQISVLLYFVANNSEMELKYTQQKTLRKSQQFLFVYSEKTI